MDPLQSSLTPGITPAEILQRQERIAAIKESMRSRKEALQVNREFQGRANSILRAEKLMPENAWVDNLGAELDEMELERMPELRQLERQAVFNQARDRARILRLQALNQADRVRANVGVIPGQVRAAVEMQARALARQIPGARPFYDGTRSIIRGTRAAVDRGSQLLRDAYVRRFGVQPPQLPSAPVPVVAADVQPGLQGGAAPRAGAPAPAAAATALDDPRTTASARRGAPFLDGAGKPFDGTVATEEQKLKIARAAAVDGSDFDARPAAQAQQLSEATTPSARAAAASRGGAAADPSAAPGRPAAPGIPATPPGTAAAVDLDGAAMADPIRQQVAAVGTAVDTLEADAPGVAQAPRSIAAAAPGSIDPEVPRPPQSANPDAPKGPPTPPRPGRSQFSFSGADWPDLDPLKWLEDRANQARQVAETTNDPELKLRAERAGRRYAGAYNLGRHSLKFGGLAAGALPVIAAAAGGAEEYGAGGAVAPAGFSLAGAALGARIGLSAGPLAPIAVPVLSGALGFGGDALGDMANRGAVYAIEKANAGDTGLVGQMGNALDPFFDTPYEKEMNKTRRELNSPMVRDMIAMRRQEEQSAYMQQQRDLMMQYALQGIYVPMGA